MTAPTTPQKSSPLGTAIRALRTTADLTLSDVSEVAGISVSYLSRVENGLASPKPTWVSNVAEAIGKHIDEHTPSA